MKNYMITLERVSKSFGHTKAVDDLSFEVKQGEIVGLLGPNGAGKTTTMRLMAGFLYPDSGRMTIAGISVGGEKTDSRAVELRRFIGYLPENNPLYKDMLVSEMLNLSADLKRIPKEKKRAALDFVVSSMAIGDVFYRPIGELSKGYKQRVGMAIALLNEPDILIMDEPTEGLDPNQRAEIRALVQRIAKNRTIIISTHVMQEAQAICTRMIIIHQGRLAADGTSEELSRAAKGERSILLEVEGDNVQSSLPTLAGVERAEFEQTGQNRFRVKITNSEGTMLQPEISRLAREKKWVIWRLNEEEQKLEDIFHKLTSEV